MIDAKTKDTSPIYLEVFAIFRYRSDSLTDLYNSYPTSGKFSMDRAEIKQLKNVFENSVSSYIENFTNMD
jgi:hypothetical protein